MIYLRQNGPSEIVIGRSILNYIHDFLPRKKFSLLNSFSERIESSSSWENLPSIKKTFYRKTEGKGKSRNKAERGHAYRTRDRCCANMRKNSCGTLVLSGAGGNKPLTILQASFEKSAEKKLELCENAHWTTASETSSASSFLFVHDIEDFYMIRRRNIYKQDLWVIKLFRSFIHTLMERNFLI